MSLAEGDGKGRGCEFGLLLHFSSNQSSLCILDLPVVLSTGVPDKPKYLQRKVLVSQSPARARKYLLKDTTDIRASMKGSANQDEDKPVRLQSPSDALFTKVWVAC